MRRFSFGTFLVDDRNRALYDTCRSIANLSYRGRLPVILVAPDGFGKTHLLYSIVNRARSGPARTGVAFVSADEFPEEVRRLLKNPEPVERARNAILLVDDLHRFTDQLETLDKLVDLFLKHGHYVVLSSNAPAQSLPQLPQTLRRRLDRGHALQVEARIAAPRPRTSGEHSAGLSEAVQSELEALRRQCQKNESDLNAAKSEVERLRGENAVLSAVANEVSPLRARLETLQRSMVPNPPAAAAAPAARQQAGAMLEKAAALLDEVEESRSKLARLRGQTLPQFPGVDTRKAQAAPIPGADLPFAAPPEPETVALRAALEQAAAERDRLEGERENLERELEALRGGVARANEERDETRRHLRSAFEKLDRYEKNLQQLRGQVDQYSQEQDRAVESRAHALSESSRLEASAVAEGLREVQAQFAAGLRVIDRMAGQLDALCTALDGTAARAEAPPETAAFFVTPAETPPERRAPSAPRHVPEESPFVAGIGTRDDSRDDDPAPAPPIRPAPAATPRRTLHHVEELGELGLFSSPFERDMSI